MKSIEILWKPEWVGRMGRQFGWEQVMLRPCFCVAELFARIRLHLARVYERLLVWELEGWVWLLGAGNLL